MGGRVQPEPLTASIETTASPRTVWRVVSDVRRTGEWSPECFRVLPLGPVRVGALLIGLNRRGRVRWATLSRVISWTAEEEIGWRVLTNRSEWRYRLRPTTAGTSITESRRTPRGEGRFALWFTRMFLGGQVGHDEELQDGMMRGLQRITTIAETLEELAAEGSSRHGHAAR